MADLFEGQSTKSEFRKFDAILKQSSKTKDGSPDLYHLKPKTDCHAESEPYRKITFGKRDPKKTLKTILLVGETGTGKTTLINVMVNYMLGVQREDKVWFEITDDQSDRSSVHSQTSIITVYGVYLQESPIDLTIIDTPGYGDTQDVHREIAINMLDLSTSENGINELDAVCLVIKATQSRLDDRQICIFDAVQSLFGTNIADNIVLLFTFSRGAIPKNVLTAVKEDQIQCAVNEQNQPVYFLFDNCQSDTRVKGCSEKDEAQHKMLEQSWEISFTGIKRFFSFLENIKPKSLKMTRDVLEQHIQFEKNISSLQSCDQEMVEKQSDLRQTQDDQEKEQEFLKNDKNVECEVEVQYRELDKVIDPGLASSVMCCINCEENCPTEESWSISSPFISKKCTSTCCTQQCKHIKGVTYKTKTRMEKRINEDLKKQYEEKMKHILSLIKNLEKELRDLETRQIKLVFEAFHCVDTLERIALNTDSLIILQHVDFLIDKLKEIDESEKAKTLEDIKSRAGEGKQRALGWINTTTGLVLNGKTSLLE
ncbi:uncharacterized protein isoform X2 [Danio rerio]|uniref:Uncharacterized protein isoform X2 n=1 Tax=Danio rerio TaxID=7955 RepID=A0A8M1PZS3_DANRE|nr:uncharacterized protein LOC100005096 [Danio rerio]|eukprot:XP_001344233.1 uncharacterized protein LOC100005096 [Danio rerio]